MLHNIPLLIDKVSRRITSTLLSANTTAIAKKDFAAVYAIARTYYQSTLSAYTYQPYLVEQWQQNTAAIEAFFLDTFSFNFLRHPVLRQTMFFELPKTEKEIQKKLLKAHFSEAELSVLLTETNLGNPLLNDLEYTSSGNTIHHLYHIAKFETETKIKIKDLPIIFELGGGYGNFARLIRMIRNDQTYVILDIPIFSAIQFVYLATIFGREQVVFFDSAQGIQPGKINLVAFHEPTIQALAHAARGGLFVSTWALSESNAATQSAIAGLDFCGAEYLLLAYQKASQQFAHAENLVNLTASFTTLYQAETEYIKDNYYLFAKRR